MTVREQLLRFLRDPAQFGAGAADPQIWQAGLDGFVVPALSGPDQHPLRRAQIEAWSGLANARAGLVLGPPGTGKTHLLAWLILGYVHARRQAGLPCRVFVTAFTLNAIGNLLDGVAERRDGAWPGGPEVWFLGNPPGAGLSNSVQVQPRLNGAAAIRDALDVLSRDAVVVGGSIWSLYRLLESRQAPGADGLTAELFDLVCIDEASQMALGHGLMACAGLKPGGRLVVAGDDRQLPPIRAAREVNLEGRQLGGSLYGFLSSAGAPEFPLDETFRLNAPLADFPERAFYPGAYRSAVPTRTLPLRADWAEGLEEWERVALDPDLPVCVLLHDGPPAASSNPFEAHVAAHLTDLLAERLEDPSRFWEERLAIISPHRAQNAAIRQRLPAALRRGAFVETVDRIQGKERDAVILSYAVADAEFALAEGEFIFASERLNVAITRARSKLVVVISRRLLEATPADQEVMDRAELLREFVFSCPELGERLVPDGQGGQVAVQIRARGLEPVPALAPLADTVPPTATLTTNQAALLLAVEAECLSNPRGGATLRALGRRVARTDSLLPDLSVLHRLGFISLQEIQTDFWVARFLDPPRTTYAVDPDTVARRIAQVVAETRTGRGAPFYWLVRDRFAWMDASGRDVLLPVLQELAASGAVVLTDSGRGLTVDARSGPPTPPEPPATEPPELSDADYRVLNALEDEEARRINFGVFEVWTSPATLADAMRRPRDEVLAALGRLAANGWVLLASEGRVRSRMAELAREVRYAKQRFAAGDAARRPYVVRSLKVEMRDRDKPGRGEPIGSEFARIGATAPAEEQRVLEALAATLTELWGPTAGIAGFQGRGLETLLAAWRGNGPDTAVVAADTGSGKTEAAAFPLIVGAAADRLRGIAGVRALMAYPRIRLAANQAQRLAGYLAALARQPGMPTLTLGLQFTQVPTAYRWADEAAGWRPLANGMWSFPLFDCPSCRRTLVVQEGGGAAGADSLQCLECGWRYDGWIGTKEALGRTPPNLFLPTTDSLHQWMHSRRYGALFGDDGDWAPPRALLADEIHLYSHVHGAQVGLALRRLAARAELNSGEGRRVLAIGMSATLGDPAATWGRLVRREGAVLISPTAEEREPNPRGREYFYFVQPEAESRGQDVAGASTTVQSFMCLAHGMRRRTGRSGGYRGLVFLDSIDKVRRLHGVYQDAEETKQLAAFRTRYLPDDPVTGQPRDRCCGDPNGCDVFRDGECWWFASNDPWQTGAAGLRRPEWPLRVAAQPVTSATSGRVEGLIKESDVVFATSSLEVGYDDPDISLVYQQYAPQNLASFIQRKGRGGRGVDDRPITGVTLSLYSSRDSWWFRRPAEMIEPSGFETPINPDNHFVRRGQVLAAALDGFARHERRTGLTALSVEGRPSAAALAEGDAMVRAVFGSEAWREFDNCESLALLLERAIARAPRDVALDSPEAVRGALPWIPTFLFDTINLPRLRVTTAEDRPDQVREEDVALALSAAAPGNPSRRFNPNAVHWRPPVQGLGPWFDPRDYATAQRPRPFESPDELLRRLPAAVRPQLAGLSGEVVRPTTLRLETLGVMQGAGWTSEWVVAQDGASVLRSSDPNLTGRRIKHDSRSVLRGFPVVKIDETHARPLPVPTVPWLDSVEAFEGHSLGGRTTGIAMARLYWGVDAELKMEDRQSEPAVFSQTFADPATGAATLHGYHVQTEGARFRIPTERLDAFVAAEVARLQAAPAERRWHAGQMLRFIVEDAAQALGINAFEARRAADLIVTAAADAALRPRLLQAVRFWDPATWLSLFEDVRATRLGQHPLLSPTRVERVARTFGDRRLQPVFEDALRAADDPARFGGWIRTCILNSLTARLRELFVHMGRGDDRQVVAHTALPAQFAGEGDDAITICEAGAYGDGTARTFAGAVAEASAEWMEDFVATCPNAEEDAVVRQALAQTERHAAWRALDINDPEALAGLAADLGLDPARPLPAALLRILFGAERLGPDRFELYDLAMAVAGTEAGLAAAMGRSPSAWELTSAVVAEAEANPDSMPGRLLAAYAALEDAAQEGSLSAAARLADQAHRLGAQLCVDGCQACVHQPSDLMSESMAEASTSRALLQRFVAY